MKTKGNDCVMWSYDGGGGQRGERQPEQRLDSGLKTAG